MVRKLQTKWNEEFIIHNGELKNKRNEERTIGYSIMTPFKTEQDKQKMEQFLQMHFKPFQNLVKGVRMSGNVIEEGETPTDDMDYKPEKEIPMLGFNYGAGISMDEERDYYFSLCYWMVVVFGDRKNFDHHENMPYIIYDGVEEWLLFVNQERDLKYECVSVDEYGYKEISTLTLLKHRGAITKTLFQSITKVAETIDQKIKDELIRLTKEWKTYTKL